MATRRRLQVDRFASAGEFREFFKARYGPTIAVYKANADDPERCAALDRDLDALAERYGVGGGTDGVGVPPAHRPTTLSCRSATGSGSRPFSQSSPSRRVGDGRRHRTRCRGRGTSVRRARESPARAPVPTEASRPPATSGLLARAIPTIEPTRATAASPALSAIVSENGAASDPEQPEHEGDRRCGRGLHGSRRRAVEERPQVRPRRLVVRPGAEHPMPARDPAASWANRRSEDLGCTVMRSVSVLAETGRSAAHRGGEPLVGPRVVPAHVLAAAGRVHHHRAAVLPLQEHRCVVDAAPVVEEHQVAAAQLLLGDAVGPRATGRTRCGAA